MDTKQVITLSLKHAFGAELTEAELNLLDEYAQTADGMADLQECREVRDLLRKVANVQIKPVDKEAMIQNFERTVRQTFKQTVFRPWGETYSLPITLGLLVSLFIVLTGWSATKAVLLGSSCLWLIATWFQRYHLTKILSRPDLYEYARESRRRSDRILKSLPGLALVAVISGLAIGAVAYGAYCGYWEFGFIMPAIMVFVLVETVAIFVHQYRKLKRSDPQVWDWWEEEIKE